MTVEHTQITTIYTDIDIHSDQDFLKGEFNYEKNKTIPLKKRFMLILLSKLKSFF